MGLRDWFRAKDEKDVFIEKMIAALKKTGESRRITYVPESFELRIGDPPTQFFLGNAWDEYRAVSVEERDRVVHNFALSLADPGIPDTWERAASRVLPRVRERVYYELFGLRVRLDGKTPGDVMHHPRPVTDHLSEGIVYDAENSIREFGLEQIQDWGVTLAEVDQRALENLRSSSRNAFASLRPGLWTSTAQDTHDATRLLLEDEIRALPVKGAHVAFVPHRTLLLITGSEDLESLEEVAGILEANIDLPRLMTFVPAKLGDDGWQTWTAPLPSLSRFELVTRQREYEEQRELLQALEGDSVFVGHSVLMEREEQRRLLTSWTESVPTLVPHSQWISFTRAEGVVGFARWEKVFETFPDLLELVPDLYPPRWRVTSFPSSGQLSRVLEELS